MTSADTASILDLLDRATRGSVWGPGAAEYDGEVAGFNVAVSHSPAAVVVAADADDVAAAVRVAAAAGYGVAVKATGHGARASDDTSIMISTRRLSDVHIDAGARTATVGAGVRWQQVLDAAAVFHLGAPSGSSTAAGAVGYALGGGLSPLGRTIGFAADLVRSFQIITAAGEVTMIDEQTDEELFWALRGGGGGGFGIVTEMVIDLLPMHTVFGGGIFFDIADAPAVLHAWRTWVQAVPESVSTSIALLHLPPDPALPAELRGRTVLHLRYAYVGSAERGQELLAPMRSIAEPIIDTVATMPMTALASIHMDPVEPLPAIERGLLLSTMTEKTIDAVLSAADLPVATVELRLMGGALDRSPRSPGSVGGRGAAFCLYLIGVAEPAIAAELPGVLDDLLSRFTAESAGRSFLNLAGTGSMDLVCAGWSATESERLEAVRHAVDPAGVFAPSARW
ncbi:FAD-binding oxidoreductase [Rhodococcoides fascians]|uniref:FAD-binding oxidoreductase n=1 Tax=Rhodococcoides fascians TaxID=1828 RepID=UPI00050CEC62|nr:FAD-binding protein [Rhodococcus fascians]